MRISSRCDSLRIGQCEALGSFFAAVVHATGGAHKNFFAFLIRAIYVLWFMDKRIQFTTKNVRGNCFVNTS